MSFLSEVLHDERGFLGFVGKAIGIAKSVFGGSKDTSQAARIASVENSARLERDRVLRELAAFKRESARQQAELQTKIEEGKSKTRNALLIGGGAVALLAVIFLVMKR